MFRAERQIGRYDFLTFVRWGVILTSNLINLEKLDVEMAVKAEICRKARNVISVLGIKAMKSNGLSFPEEVSGENFEEILDNFQRKMSLIFCKICESWAPKFVHGVVHSLPHVQYSSTSKGESLVQDIKPNIGIEGLK